MSIWLITLGLAAGYLMQKNTQHVNQLDQAKRDFNSAAEPANPGPRSDEIRTVQRAIPAADRNESLNVQDLTTQDARQIRAHRDEAAQQVVSYENAFVTPPIEGVYLHYDNHGV